MIVVLNKKLVMCSQTQLDFLKEGPSEGFDSFEVCLWLVHPTNQLFHSTSCAVICAVIIVVSGQVRWPRIFVAPWNLND